MSQQLPRSTRRSVLARRVAIGAVAVPALLVGLSGTASAAEITPIAEYVDGLVADTSADVISIITSLLT